MMFFSWTMEKCQKEEHCEIQEIKKHPSRTRKILIIVLLSVSVLLIISSQISCPVNRFSQKMSLHRMRLITFSANQILNNPHSKGVKVEEIPLDNFTSSNTKLTKVQVVSLMTNNSLKDTVDFFPKYKIYQQQGLVPNRQLPSALIIGVKKGGTRALLEFLRLHPDIRAAGSEVHFFDHHYSKGFHWYRQRMPPTLSGQITMEKTPSYFVTAQAPKRVQHMNPGTKLIVVVRDPVTRAISDYTQVKTKRSDMPKFEDLVFLNGSHVVDTNWAPLKIGVYARHLERWLQYFPLSQFLFVSGEGLIADPAVEMIRAQDFLGLKRVICEKHFYFNATKGFPCLLKSEGGAVPHCLGKNKGRSHPRVDSTTLQRLRDFYKPFNQRFYQLTGMDFGWM